MDNIHDILVFRTAKYKRDAFYGRYSKKFVEVFPLHSDWTYTLLSCFLNEHGNYIKASRRASETTIKKGVEIQKFIFKNITNEALKIYVSLYGDKIEVLVTNSVLIQEWKVKTVNELSDIGAGRKKLTKRERKELTYFELIFLNPNDGTKALYMHSPLLFNSNYDFSNIFYYFCKKIKSLPPKEDASSIKEYIDLWITDSKEKMSSIEDLQKHLRGYLKLNLQRINSIKRLAHVNVKVKDQNGDDVEKVFYVVSGIYLSPWAKSLLKNNPDLIQGLLLDTTWKVMSLYVTSIVMGSAMNTGIPLGFAFGHGEDKNLYIELLSTLQEKTEIELRGTVIESDQGSALKSACSHFQMTHIACLRHLLVI